MAFGAERKVALGTLSLRPDGILHVVFDFAGPSSAGAADEFLAARAELVDAKPCPVIIEIRQIPYTTRWIRTRFMRLLPDPACRALVTTNDAFKAMYRTYELLSRSPVPSQTFQTVEQAVA